MLTSYNMAPKPMTKEEFINLLHTVLEEKKQRNKIVPITYVEPYNYLYTKCLLGYEISYAKGAYEENKFNFGSAGLKDTTINASDHLKFVIETLVSCYSKEAVANILKDI